jgi:hypothetical protein
MLQTLPKPRNIAWGLIAGLVLGVPPAAAINIGVTPPRLYVDINSSKTRTQSIRILNLDSQPIQLKAYVQSWTINQENKLQVIPPDEQSLEQWIVFTPAKFTIAPHSAQTIRFSIRPRVKPEVGEHRAILFVEEVSPDKSSSPGINILAKLGITVYGYVGNIKRIGILNSVTVDTKNHNRAAVFDVSSQGNASVQLQGQYAIWPAAKYPGSAKTKLIENLEKPDTKIPETVLDAGTLPSIPVLPNSHHQIRVPMKKALSPGEYVLDINGSLGTLIIKQGIPFTVTAANK